MRQDKQGCSGPSPHGAPSLGRESPVELVCRGGGCRKLGLGRVEGISREPGDQVVCWGRMEEFCLCSLWPEAGRSQWEARNQLNKVTKVTEQSLAPRRSSVPRNNPGWCYRGLVPPTRSPGAPAYWHHGEYMNECHLPWGTYVELSDCLV